MACFLWANERFAQKKTSDLLICSKSFFEMRDLSDLLTVAHFSLAIWANRSQSLIKFEQSERTSALTQIVSRLLCTHPNCISGATHSPKLYLGRYALTQIVSGVLRTHPNCIRSVIYSSRWETGSYINGQYTSKFQIILYLHLIFRTQSNPI